MNTCINIETNTCYFGHGGIVVDVTLQMIRFREITPPAGAGVEIRKKDGIKIGDWDYTGNMLCVLFSTMDEIKTVYNYLNRIEEEQGGSFKFKDVVFDFTAYKQESIEIVKKALRRIELNLISFLAC